MSFLAWLFGKKAEPTAETRTEQRPPLSSNGAAGRTAVPADEAQNLKRWQESGQARAWVEAHNGSWDHAAWLALLEQLRHSSFWPLQPDAVGKVLEKVKREWLQRN